MSEPRQLSPKTWKIIQQAEADAFMTDADVDLTPLHELDNLSEDEACEVIDQVFAAIHCR